MGTRGDFYIGRGADAKWLGSVAWDGDPDGMPEELISHFTSEEEFVKALKKFAADRDDWTEPSKHGWPWPWTDSQTTDYAYAYENGTVYMACFGHGWVTIDDLNQHKAEMEVYEKEHKAWITDGEKGDAPEEPDHPFDRNTEKEVFPDMTDVQNVDFGARSGIIIIGG